MSKRVSPLGEARLGPVTSVHHRPDDGSTRPRAGPGSHSGLREPSRLWGERREPEDALPGWPLGPSGDRDLDASL